MNTSDRGLAFIKEVEGGVHLEAYLDSGGVWSVGYGHTGPEVREGLVITEAIATTYLKADIAWAEGAVNELRRKPNQHQFDALVSFTFNVGAGGFRSSTLRRMWENGAHAREVGAQLVRWFLDGGQEVRGLMNRRVAELYLWTFGDYAPDHTRLGTAT